MAALAFGHALQPSTDHDLRPARQENPQRCRHRRRTGRVIRQQRQHKFNFRQRLALVERVDNNHEGQQWRGRRQHANVPLRFFLSARETLARAQH